MDLWGYPAYKEPGGLMVRVARLAHLGSKEIQGPLALRVLQEIWASRGHRALMDSRVSRDPPVFEEIRGLLEPLA